VIGLLLAAYRWFDATILGLGREMRLSYLPPLMVYTAAGISGLTGIVGTFFVKEYLGLSAEFQIAMIPMLTWIANSAPVDLKATYFAVMASFTNLALLLAQLGTKYLNQVFTVSREVKNASTSAIEVAADYSELGSLMLTAGAIGLIMPMLAISPIRLLRWRSA
jgi:hypothetical protein